MDRKELIKELVRTVQSPNNPSVYAKNHATVWQKKPYTAADVGLWYKDEYYQEYGFAKVQYPDEWDAEYGKQLAIRKACAAIAKRILAE